MEDVKSFASMNHFNKFAIFNTKEPTRKLHFYCCLPGLIRIMIELGEKNLNSIDLMILTFRQFCCEGHRFFRN